MTAARKVVQGLFAAALVFMTSAAIAQTAPNDAETEAKAAMKRGLAAFARHDVELALTEYKKAQRLVPDANVPHRYAAEALVELGRYEEAIQEYETYLRIKPDVSDAAEIRHRMELAHAKIDGSIDLTSSPSGAAVFVDGSATKVGVTPIPSLRLRRGPHTIVLQLPGRRDVVLSPVVKGGEAHSLAANFADPSPQTTAPAPTVHDTPPADGSRTRTTIGWIILGVGGAVLGTALVLDAIVVPSKLDTFESQRRTDDPAAGGTLSGARTLQTVSIVGYAAGGALAATGLVLALWPKKTSSPLRGSVGLGGAYLTGTF